MEHSPTRDFLVGLFVLAGIAAVAYLSVHVGGFAWRSSGGLNLYAEFDQIGGLTARAPVVISGVRVGEVRSITLDQNYRARVEMDLEKTLRLSSDTSASIVSSGILGDRYIELQPGAEEDLLKPGGKITFTESAVILERLIGQVIYGATKDGKPTTSPARPAEKRE
jgi:phospholipid/cholesterol/gamma-HCH transport system substrate-binding protein